MMHGIHEMLTSCLKARFSSTGTRKQSFEARRNVKFADICGRQLVSVKIISPNSSRKRQETTVPQNVKKYNNYYENNNDHLRYSGITARNFFNKNSKTYLKCCFMQPSSRHDWNKHSIQRKVSLENAFVGGNNGMVLVGLIRVWNIAYEKKVFVRYSTDNWSSYVDLPAEFMSQSHEGTIDKFVFKLLAPVGLAVGDTIEFAVCYCVNEQKHWDNNKGNNYIVKCCG